MTPRSGSRLPAAGLATPAPHHHALHDLDPHRWRGVLAFVVLAATWAIATFVTSVVAVQLAVASGDLTIEEAARGAVPFGPFILLSGNLSLASLVPASFFVQRVVYRRPVRELHSAAGGFRWRLLPRLALVAVPLWLAYLVVSSVLDFPGSDYSGGLSLAVLTVVLLTTPLQEAGEEYAFRGVLTRAVGAWFRSPRLALVVATVVASALFMASHASGDPWLNAYYFLFGVGMALMAWRTSGLEAPVTVHVVNNVLTLGVIALFNGGAASTDRSAGTGSAYALVPVAVVAVMTAVVWVASRRTSTPRARAVTADSR